MRDILRSVAQALAFIVACETLVALGLAHPDAVARLPQPFRQLMRGVYLDGPRNIIQYEPDCARYDAGLSYTLKPGDFVFSNAEFRTPYRVNSLGIRSDEAALKAPELVVLGDSRAMGWGVGQDETYSSLLSARTGLKTLNACVSSYGTVREMRLLDKLDLSSARWLVLNYVENDDEENARFAGNGNVLKVMSEETYNEARQRYLDGKRYFPGRYTVLLLFRAGAEVYNGVLHLLGADRVKNREENFLNALLHAGRRPLDGVRLVIVGDGDFVKRLKELIAANDYPACVEEAVLVSDDLPESGYFTLDNHPNASGHRLIADRLAAVLR